MKNRSLLWLVLFTIAFLSLDAHAATPVLNNSAHEAAHLLTDLLILEPSATVDRTTMAPNDNTFDPNLVADSLNPLVTFYSQANDAPVNHSPYAVLSTPFTGYTLSIETANYATFEGNAIANGWSYSSSLAALTPPPVYSFTVGLGLTGPGVEFTLSNNYKGFDTTSLSTVEVGVAALFAAMQINHSTWTWPDIKGALRQTAANWATGYDPTNFGYGVVDFDSATALANTNAIFLQPPVLQVSAVPPGRLSVTLYPFRQSRRDHEIVFVAPLSYVWPLKNEYTTADLNASGGAGIYASNGTDVIPTAVVSVSVPPGRYNVIAFTTDGSGNYSRVEAPFSLIPMTITNNPCLP